MQKKQIMHQSFVPFRNHFGIKDDFENRLDNSLKLKANAEQLVLLSMKVCNSLLPVAK